MPSLTRLVRIWRELRWHSKLALLLGAVVIGVWFLIPPTVRYQLPEGYTGWAVALFPKGTPEGLRQVTFDESGAVVAERNTGEGVFIIDVRVGDKKLSHGEFSWQVHGGMSSYWLHTILIGPDDPRSEEQQELLREKWGLAEERWRQGR